MTLWTFQTPVAVEAPASWGDRLFIRVKLARGISILEGPSGIFQAMRFPTQDEIAAAVTVYMGGHEYEVDDATKAALEAAGVGVTDANFSFAPGGFGTGFYGRGIYGG